MLEKGIIKNTSLRTTYCALFVCWVLETGLKETSAIIELNRCSIEYSLAAVVKRSWLAQVGSRAQFQANQLQLCSRTLHGLVPPPMWMGQASWPADGSLVSIPLGRLWSEIARDMAGAHPVPLCDVKSWYLTVKRVGPGVVVHTCHLSASGGWSRRTASLRSAWATEWDFVIKFFKTKERLRMWLDDRALPQHPWGPRFKPQASEQTQ